MTDDERGDKLRNVELFALVGSNRLEMTRFGAVFDRQSG
jgi:hypothetical protein